MDDLAAHARSFDQSDLDENIQMFDDRLPRNWQVARQGRGGLWLAAHVTAESASECRRPSAAQDMSTSRRDVMSGRSAGMMSVGQKTARPPSQPATCWARKSGPDDGSINIVVGPLSVTVNKQPAGPSAEGASESENVTVVLLPGVRGGVSGHVRVPERQGLLVDDLLDRCRGSAHAPSSSARCCRPGARSMVAPSKANHWASPWAVVT